MNLDGVDNNSTKATLTINIAALKKTEIRFPNG